MLARSHQDLAPAGAAGQGPCAERRQHPSAQQRGFTDSRWAEDSDQRPLRQPGDQLGDDPVPATEELGIRALERGQTLERAHHSLCGSMKGALAVEPDILVEDHALEFSELRAWT